ncbi:hypothetical protein Taro_054180, partial [Colocasia esculenta]|nr:hypothetical protein [Colocasia esculenta]
EGEFTVERAISTILGPSNGWDPEDRPSSKPFLRLRGTHSAAHASFLSANTTTEVCLRPLRDVRTCISALQACASAGDHSVGEKIHSWVVVNGFHASPFVLTSLINFYTKCRHLADALAVFRHIESPNLFQWNIALSGMMAYGLLEVALMLYFEMERTGAVPDRFTYPCLVKACSDLREGPLVARSIHARLFKVGLESDVFISSSLINAYMKMGLLVLAKKMFGILSERDVVLWNSMVNGFAQMGQFKDALELFQQIGKEGFVPSKFTVTGITSVFAATEDTNGGRMIHGFAKKSGYESDITVSNSLIDMYGKCQPSGDHRRTMKLFDSMKDSGIPPDPVTISAVLPACAHMAALFHGRMIHGFMVVNGLGKNSDVFLDNAIMDMYAKCGSLDDAKMVFDKMASHDTASWNIMIMSYALRGDGVKSCGIANEGREILDKMESEYNVVPTIEHYACVVDMLGRAGRLMEAYNLAVNVPIGFSPVVWRAYLTACQIHGDMDQHGDVLEVRKAMRHRNVRKAPGCSWIELGLGMQWVAFGICGDGGRDSLPSVLGIDEAWTVNESQEICSGFENQEPGYKMSNARWSMLWTTELNKVEDSEEMSRGKVQRDAKSPLGSGNLGTASPSARC